MLVIPSSASRPAGVTELGGLPLGLFSHSAADASIVALEPRAALLLISRGLAEPKLKGKEYGMGQVKELFSAAAQTAEEICTSLLGHVQQFAGPKPPEHAGTVLALARSAAAAQESPRAGVLIAIFALAFNAGLCKERSSEQLIE